MTEQLSDRLLDKIKKLHAMANQSASPMEAAIAVQKLQEMLYEYNLDISGLNLNSKEADPFINEIVILDQEASWYEPDNTWMATLLYIVSKHNFCKSVYSPDITKVTCFIVGKKHNIEIVEYFYHYLVKELQRIGLQECATQIRVWKKSYGKVIQTERKWKKDFFAGALSVMDERFREVSQRYSMQESTRSLVVQESAALEEMFDKFYPSVSQMRNTAKRGEAFYKGQERGKSVPINPGVKSSADNYKQLGTK